MIIFPAIDLFEGKVVRLLRGDYAQMTVYSDHPEEIGKDFAAQGATHVHLVDLEGARSGSTPNLETVLRIRESTGLFCEIGGGIRNMETVDTYLKAGLDRVILGTAAVEDRGFLKKTVEMLEARGYSVGNVDATIIAQKPKLAPYIDRMRDGIAGALRVGPDQVNVKATTEEQLGFTGRQEGISAHAVCVIIGT